MNSVDIMYYENMIDIISENRKIIEAVISGKCTKYFTESEETISLCEAKVTETVIAFFKTILNKVIEFFKKLINIVSDVKNFSPDKKLISAVENKIKLMTKEEKDNYYIELEINNVGSDSYLDYLIERSEEGVSFLENIMYDVKDLLYKDVNPDDLELDNFDMNMEYPTKSKITIRYNDLKEIISQYENTYTRVKRLRSQMQADQTSMNAYKKIIESATKKNDTENNNDVLARYKDITINVCNLIMKANSEIIKEILYSFRLYERALRDLIAEN